MKISRRDFIGLGTKGIIGGIIAYIIPSLLREPMQTQSAGKSVYALDLKESRWEEHQWGFICDNERCIGCGRCVVACKRENDVPWEPEFNRTWVERYIITENEEIFVDSPNSGRDGFTDESFDVKYPNLIIRKSFFVPKLCNQCDNPPCVTVCPVGATYMTEDRISLVDQEHCIGCGYCIQSCPYGARYFLPDKNVVDKCTWCYHRITQGVVPACVAACPRGARDFGDLKDPKSKVREVLDEKRIYVLKPELGTEPKVYYVGFEKGVH
jgi:Fe-S-cluster-containing dehydrogenase component